MLESLSHEDFAERVGETFTATAPDGGSLNLTLTDVTVTGDPPEGHRTPFSLEFRDDKQEHLPQQMFSVEHPEHGALDVFLVPIGPDAEGMRYQAVFG